MKRHANHLFILLTAACSLLAMTTPSFAINVVTNGGFESAAQAPLGLNEGQDTNLNTISDGWLNWAQSSGNTMARIWNPSNLDRWGNSGNEFYDTSWGGNADEGTNVLAIRTMGWDYRPSSSISGTTNLSTVWHDDWGNRLWTVGADGGNGDPSGVRYEWRYADGGTPSSGAGTAADPYLYANEGSVGAWNDTASRTFEAVGQIVGAFDPTAKYTLTARVGRLAANGYNAGAVDFNGDGITDGTSSRFWTDTGATGTAQEGNAVEALWGGYMVDLMAGGDYDKTNGNFDSWLSGQTTNPAGPGYITTIASDDNTQAVAVDGWSNTATLTYIPGISGDFSAMAGKDLIVRLAAKEIAGQHQNTTTAAFDNVVLTKIVAGDANEDDAVNFTDFNILANNYNGPTTGKTWATADFTGNGDVEFTDFNLLINNYNQPVAASASTSLDQSALSEIVSANAVNPGEAQLLVGLDGSLTLEGGNVNLNGYSITSALGQLIPDGDNNASPFLFYLSNTANSVDAGGFAPVNVNGLLLLDAAISPANLANIDLVFQYGTSAGTFTGNVIVEQIPEPSSLVLMGVGLLGMVRLARRKRSSAS